MYISALIAKDHTLEFELKLLHFKFCLNRGLTSEKYFQSCLSSLGLPVAPNILKDQE